MIPDPASQVLARGVFEAGDFVQKMVIELVFQRLEGALHVGEVAKPAHVLVNRPPQAKLDTEGMAVQAATLMPRGHVWQQVRRFEREFLIDFQGRSSWYPEVLMGLKAKTPDRVGEAVGNGRLGVRVALGAVHRLQEEVSEIQIL